ncbi:uncharacterized protein LOC127741120 [Arachis duranensis]|uniref:Uncharacterized protein LOC127741120 n=1 Tax=Arachis duranensis TaxID=130453 RepID=A0A9C6TGW2_ARADU|nr:uncharacterized protein LOC127741120 [Arachis duranensis]
MIEECDTPSKPSEEEEQDPPVEGGDDDDSFHSMKKRTGDRGTWNRAEEIGVGKWKGRKTVVPPSSGGGDEPRGGAEGGAGRGQWCRASGKRGARWRGRVATGVGGDVCRPPATIGSQRWFGGGRGVEGGVKREEAKGEREEKRRWVAAARSAPNGGGSGDCRVQEGGNGGWREGEGTLGKEGRNEGRGCARVRVLGLTKRKTVAFCCTAKKPAGFRFGSTDR